MIQTAPHCLNRAILGYHHRSGSRPLAHPGRCAVNDGLALLAAWLMFLALLIALGVVILHGGRER